MAVNKISSFWVYAVIGCVVAKMSPSMYKPLERHIPSKN